MFPHHSATETLIPNSVLQLCSAFQTKIVLVYPFDSPVTHVQGFIKGHTEEWRLRCFSLQITVSNKVGTLGF